MKYIIVSGGVMSGLGKGITAASLALLLKSRGLKVTTVKCDMYLNMDAGTMNPIEHGEVFVTEDGLETDQDLGHYERFLNQNLYRVNYMTNGSLYWQVLQKERALEYGGACVQPYHHIPPEIIKRWQNAGKYHKADVVVIELGGTVGEYEGLLFFEAVRRLKLTNHNDVALVHVGYLPAPAFLGELKSKPLQQSISLLNSLGLCPDFIVCRAEKPIDLKRKEKIALASGIPAENIISNPDVGSIYEVPLLLDKQTLATKLCKKLGLKAKKKNLDDWNKLISNITNSKKEVTIGIAGKYQKTGDYVLEDSYVCVNEAIKHAAWANNIKPKLVWLDTEELESMPEKEILEKFNKLDGIIVPQGWGKRGVEGKLKAIKVVRENKIPYLGLCFGMQMAVIEFARNVLKLKDANSEEVNDKTKHPVVHVMPHQKELLKNKQYGGTIRLGGWPCKIKAKTKLFEIYKKSLVSERHRHRYEFNNKYKDKFEKAGLTISGTSPDGNLVEAIELKDHPFFVGTQFHPEYISRPLSPHPLFVAFIKACLTNH